MSKSRYVLFAAGLALCAGPVAAEQPETGTRLAAPKSRGVTSVSMTAKDQAVGAKRIAECIYNKKGTLARQTLLAPNAETGSAAMSRLMGEVRCFGDDASNDLVEVRIVQIPPPIMRGMLAEAALDRAESQAKALPALPLQQIYQRNWYALTGRHLTVDEMGACIADTNPAGIMALVNTVPVSKEEAVAFTALRPSLGTCLRAGTKLQASQQALRAALAEALFQRLNAPAPALAPVVEAAKK